MGSARKKVVVIGAGFAGLWIARRLLQEGFEVEVIEQGSRPGGLLETIRRDGFLFDLGPHILVASHAEHFREVLGPDLLGVRGFYGFGYRGRQILSPISPGNLIRTLGCRAAFPMAAGMAWHRLPLVGPRPPWKNVDELITARFGGRINQALFRDYIPKVTGLPSIEVSLEWFQERHRFYKEHSLEKQLLKKALAVWRNRFLPRDGAAAAPGLELYYPRDGAQMLTDALAGEIGRLGAKIGFEARVAGIESDKGLVQSVRLENGGGAPSRVEGDFFVSTAPVTELPRLFGGALGAGADSAGRVLSWRHLRLFYALVDRERLSDKIQIYFTEKDYPFKRIYEPKNLAPAQGTPRTTALCAEVCYDEGDAVDRAGEETVFGRVREGICGFYGLSPREVHFLFSRRVPFSYAVYRIGYAAQLAQLAAALHGVDNFISYGRQGSFRYNHLVDRIVDAAESVMQYLSDPQRGKRGFRKEPDAKADFF